MTIHELNLYSKITDHIRERSELDRLKRKLDRETRAREEAEKLLEERSGQLFDVVDSLEQQMSKTKLLSSAVEAAQDGIAITDADGNFQYLNRAHESMFDYDPGELVGQNWSVLYDSVSLLRLEREIMPEFAKVGRWRGEAIGVAKTGRSVYQEVTLTALANGGLICATRDVSSRRESERKLRDLSDKLRVAEREAALFTVASAITHDMNNLLFAVRGHALLLDQQIDNNSEVHRTVERIVAASDEASLVVGSLKQFQNEQSVRTETVSIEQVIANAISVTKPLCPERVLLKVDTCDISDVVSNETLIFRCLVNMLKNAFEATESGGTVRVTCRPFGAQDRLMNMSAVLGDLPPDPAVLIDVSDTGKGIPSDVVESIFDPFFTTKTASGGTGLGLQSLTMLNEHSRAAVRVNSLEGQGSKFQIVFPGIARIQDLSPVNGKSKSSQSEQLRVLVVDDHERVGIILSSDLTAFGHQVTSMTNPKKALEKIEQDPDGYDVLITDLRMPEMSGDILARYAKKASRSIKCVLISGQPEFADVDRLFEHTLQKPVTREQLNQALNSLFR